MPDHRALTLRANGLLNCLRTQAKVCYVFTDNPRNHEEKMFTVEGIWDTGATGSVITKSVVTKLGLKPVGMTAVHTANGTANQNQYLVNLILPNGVIIQAVKVTEAELTDTDLLIGMDVINLGDFSITNLNGKTVMSFRVPSCHELDFVQIGPSLSGLSRAERRQWERQQKKSSR